MELTLQKYGSYEKFEQATGGSLLSKPRIWSHVRKYMVKEGCMGEVGPGEQGGRTAGTWPPQRHLVSAAGFVSPTLVSALKGSPRFLTKHSTSRCLLH